MAYKTEQLFEQAAKICETDGIYFIEDIVALLPCDKTTFYKHFPVDSNELNEIKKILNNKKVTKKAELRINMAKSERSAEVLALYKLIGTDTERKKLSQGYVDITSDGEKLGKDGISLNINFQDFAEDDK